MHDRRAVENKDRGNPFVPPGLFRLQHPPDHIHFTPLTSSFATDSSQRPVRESVARQARENINAQSVARENAGTVTCEREAAEAVLWENMNGRRNAMG